MRRAIFGLGRAQVGACIAALTLVGLARGLPVTVAFVTGFALTSTATVMQFLEERCARSSSKGRRSVAILLLGDLAIVPLLAAGALLTPGESAAGATDRAVSICRSSAASPRVGT